MEAAGHAKVDDELAGTGVAIVEVEQEVLPAAPDCADPMPDGGRGLGELRRGVGVGVHDAMARYERFQL
jgi:hypothetical protein